MNYQRKSTNEMVFVFFLLLFSVCFVDDELRDEMVKELMLSTTEYTIDILVFFPKRFLFI